MSNFSLLTPVFEHIDNITSEYVVDVTSDAITAITPVVSAGLTLAFVAMGIMVILNKIEMPVVEFLGKSLRIGIVTSIALAGGMYQTDIADAIVDLPDDLAHLVIADATTGTAATNAFDEAAGKGFQTASKAFEQASFLSGDGLVMGMVGIVIILSTAILTAIGAGFLIMAKVSIAVLVGLGPIFILALLFKPLERFFELWMGQLFNYILMIVLFSAVFAFLMDIYSGYVENISFKGDQNLGYILGGSVILAMAFLVLLLQLPAVASGLASGVGVGFLSEMRSIRGAVGSRAMRNGNGDLMNRGSGAIGAGQAAGRGVKAGFQKMQKYMPGKGG